MLQFQSYGGMSMHLLARNEAGFVWDGADFVPYNPANLGTYWLPATEVQPALYSVAEIEGATNYAIHQTSDNSYLTSFATEASVDLQPVLDAIENIERGGLTEEQAIQVAETHDSVAVIRDRQNTRVPEPTPFVEIRQAVDPAKAVVLVRTADFLSVPLVDAPVTIMLKDPGLLVIGGVIRHTRYATGITDGAGEVVLEVWHQDTLTEAGREPDYTVDIPDVENFNIRVPPEGGLASALQYP